MSFVNFNIDMQLSEYIKKRKSSLRSCLKRLPLKLLITYPYALNILPVWSREYSP